MADQHLKFNIGSAFSGEGFKQAQASVANMNKGVRAATSAAAGLSSALGGLDSSAAKAMGAVTGMMNALMTLNATAIITQTAMMAVTMWVNKVNEQIEALKERTRSLKSSVDESFSRILAGSVKEAHDEIRSIAGDFDRITRQATAFTAALNGLNASVATGGIVNLEVEKVNKMLEAHSDAEKAQIEATYNLQIATAKAAATQEAQTAKIESVRAELANNEKRIALYDEEVAAIQRKRAELEEARVAMLETDKAKAGRIRDEINKLAEEEARLMRDQNAAREQSKLLAVKEQQAVQDAANAAAQASIAVAQAKGKVDDLAKKADELAAKEKEAADKLAEGNRLAAEKAERLKTEKEVQDQARAIQQKVNDAAKEVADAERAYAAALAKYEANFENNKIFENLMGDNGNGRRKGLAIPVRIDGAIKAEVVAKDLETAMKEGLIRSVKDMDRFNRDRARQLDRDEKDRWNQLERERQRYNQLKERSRKTWSKADADFAEKFEKLRDTALAQKKEIDDARARLRQAQQREKDNHDNLKKIKERFEALGLK